MLGAKDVAVNPPFLDSPPETTGEVVKQDYMSMLTQLGQGQA